MRKRKSAARRQPGKPARAVRAVSGSGKQVRPGSKLETIVGLLKRPGGCTREEVLEAVKWPSVSMNQQAAAAGLELKVAKVDGVKRYSAA